jgi:intermediate peptidase
MYMVRHCSSRATLVRLHSSNVVNDVVVVARRTLTALNASLTRTIIPTTTTTTTATATTKREYHNSNDNNNKLGLFSIPGLNHPSDFLRLAKLAIVESDSLRSSLSPNRKSKSPTTDNNDDDSDDTPVITISHKEEAVDVLYKLDQISKTVCNVIDAAELCRSAHVSGEWRDKANDAFGTLQDYIGTLNTDKTLYMCLATIMTAQYYNQLTEEEQRFCFLLKREFEVDGIHLPAIQRQQVKELHNHVTTLETLYMSNLTHSQKKFMVDAELVQSVVPKHVLEANGAIYYPYGGSSHPVNTSSTSTSTSPAYQLIADTPITHSITSFAPDGNLRRQVYMESMTSCSENLDVLDSLIEARHRLAQSLGFASYSHRFLQDKMVQSPGGVADFLRDVQARIRPSYVQEMELLQKVKYQIEGSTTMEPWDIQFYTKLCKAQGYGGGIDPNELADYLSLTNCLNATQLLVQQLFGIRMEQVPIAPEERWDIDMVDRRTMDGTFHNTATATATAATAPPAIAGDEQEQIRKFIFYQEDGKELGLMYLDLHPRPGKYTHAAHFTVRCGCRMDGPQSDFQLPIVALVCNMNPGQASFSSHQEVETFLHEFGHALHSLLSRTNFQHLSGTRAAMDFVETPSHWMEHYAWDAQFLPLLAVKPNGDVIPDSMIAALTQSRNQFRFLEMTNQIILASFDQTIFGPRNVSDTSSQQRPSPQTIWAAAHRENGVPFADGTHSYTNVGHLVTYGAGYYGYLYSQVFASAIWNQLFRGRSFQRESGEKIWKKVLQHGGGRDANVMLKDLLGYKPTVENYWNSLVSQGEKQIY